MSCRSDCPCPPHPTSRPKPCPDVTFQCPVVCKNSVPNAQSAMEMFPVDLQLSSCIIKEIVAILEDPGKLCTECVDGSTTEVICVERCTIPFTGQQVTTIIINLEDTCDLKPIKIQIFEKCNTLWFKLPNVLLLDPTYANDYPGSIGSVSITKSLECPTTWTGRILIDDGNKLTMCYPINFKITVKTELIAKCDCPAYLETFVNYVVDTPFEKMLSSGEIFCLDGPTAAVLAVKNIKGAVQNIFEAFVISQSDTIQKKCGCGICAIGNRCDTASSVCASYP